jgi:hypothetical protein
MAFRVGAGAVPVPGGQIRLSPPYDPRKAVRDECEEREEREEREEPAESSYAPLAGAAPVAGSMRSRSWPAAQAAI